MKYWNIEHNITTTTSNDRDVMARSNDPPPPDDGIAVPRASGGGGGESYRRRPGPAAAAVPVAPIPRAPSSSSSTVATSNRRRSSSSSQSTTTRRIIGPTTLFVVFVGVVVFASAVAVIFIVVSSFVASSRGGGGEGGDMMIRGGGGGRREYDDAVRGGTAGMEEEEEEEEEAMPLSSGSGSMTATMTSRTTVLAAAAAAGKRIEMTTKTEKEKDGIDDPFRRRRRRIIGAIPPVLIFTYHTDLLNTPVSDLVDDEDVSLATNVRSIINLHPDDTTIRFLNDDDCIMSIKVALGDDTNLTNYFRDETRGMYKADICRGAALYETGGLYFDVDIEARMSLYDVIDIGTEFVTTYVHVDSNHRGMFFQAFIGSRPRHPILRRYLELFVLYYEGKVDVKGPLGVYFLRMAHDDVVGKGKKKKEEEEEDDRTIDLWQEVRYRPELFPEVTRDHWGARRACQMLVVAPPSAGRKERMVPLFSHANGSRMCGGKDTNKKG